MRITHITVRNFKNVIYGSISLSDKIKDYRSSILGIYGQNGSGKTALIDALELLKYALCGRMIPSRFADCINADTDEAELDFALELRDKDNILPISYRFHLISYSDEMKQNSESPDPSLQEKKVGIIKENPEMSHIFGKNHENRKAARLDRYNSHPDTEEGPPCRKRQGY